MVVITLVEVKMGNEICASTWLIHLDGTVPMRRRVSF